MTSDKYNKILLVDDEKDIRDVLSISLMDMGYEVHTAENGKKALELFDIHRFPIVLTDIKMPVMDGIKLLKQIKQIAPLTEIIMITGHGDMDLAIESFRNQAVEFITKPVDVATLEIAINRAKEKIEITEKLSAYTEHLETLVMQKTNELSRVAAGSGSRKDLTSMMDNIPLLMFFVDNDLKITAFNTLFKQHFGDKPGEFCFQVCRQADSPCSDCPAVKTFHQGKSNQAEVTYSTLNGQDISYLSWTSPILDSHDKISEVMIMATDISQVLDIQDHLSSLGLMIGSVSHGIKGLLTGLEGGVYVLDSALEKQDQDQAREGLDMVRVTVSKIRKMILDILFYSKERELKKESISAKLFAGDLIRLTKAKAEKHGISLQQSLPATDFEFNADQGVLHAAFINILDNAVDACAADGAKKDHEIFFSLSLKKNTIEFTISDNGVGMDKPELDNAFKLFHSGKGKKGTGLGLFIADKSIRQHGGSIRAESKKGKGSTFVVTLPFH